MMYYPRCLAIHGVHFWFHVIEQVLVQIRLSGHSLHDLHGLHDSFSVLSIFFAAE